MKRSDIIEAWSKIRKIDSTIPDEVLDFMKDAAIERLQEDNKVILHVNDPGDPSVGISPVNSTVAIQTELMIDDEFIVEVIKPSVAEMFDVPLKRVQTQEEYEADQKVFRGLGEING